MRKRKYYAFEWQWLWNPRYWHVHFDKSPYGDNYQFNVITICFGPFQCRWWD